MGCVAEETETGFVECGDEGVVEDCPGVGVLAELGEKIWSVYDVGMCLMPVCFRTCMILETSLPQRASEKSP